jgi:hypothetical protein
LLKIEETCVLITGFSYYEPSSLSSQKGSCHPLFSSPRFTFLAEAGEKQFTFTGWQGWICREKERTTHPHADRCATEEAVGSIA